MSVVAQVSPRRGQSALQGDVNRLKVGEGMHEQSVAVRMAETVCRTVARLGHGSSRTAADAGGTVQAGPCFRRSEDVSESSASWDLIKVRAHLVARLFLPILCFSP